MAHSSEKPQVKFKEWLKQPVTIWERIITSILAAFVFFIIGVLLRFFTSESISLFPVSELIDTMKWWAITGALTGVILGALKPRWVQCILWPFSLIGLAGS